VRSLAPPLLGLVAVLALAAFAGRPAARWVLSRADRSSSPAGPVSAAVVILLASAALTQALGLEAVFGAFVGGAVIGASPDFDLARLAPLRTFALSVLAPIFFATAGLRMDLTLLGRPQVLAVALVVLLVAIAGKFIGAFLGALARRLTRWEALALGAGMNARGVIEVIVATVGLRLGVISTAGYTTVIFVAIVTSLMAPPILRWAMRRVVDSPEEAAGASARARFAGGSEVAPTGRVTVR
jgi:Kef-type K+ transport system membrane component KefB